MSNKIYILRTVNPNLESHHQGFIWKESGEVVCPDFDPAPVNRFGLFGLKNGIGDINMLNWRKGANWLVCECDEEDCVELENTIKFKKCLIVFYGTRKDATDFIAKKLNIDCVDCRCIAINDDTEIVCGKASNVICGDRAKATAGECSIVSAGCDGTAITSNNSMSSSRDRGTSISKDFSFSLSCDRGTSISKNNSYSFSGRYGISSVGKDGVAFAGLFGIVKADLGSTIIIQYINENNEYRVSTGYIDNITLKANTWYTVNNTGNFIKIEENITNE